MSTRTVHWRVLVAATMLMLAVTAAYAFGATPAASAYAVQAVGLWKTNAAPVGWSSSLNRVVYNSRGANGLYNAYSANPDGSGAQCLTCTLPSYSGRGTRTNRGASDVSPNGKYMLATVEEPVHGGGIGAAWTEPGAGGANNVWLYTTDGQHAWPLTNITTKGQLAYGSLWPRFDHTGNEIVWASAYAPALANFGFWRLKVANIVWSGGVPSLANIRTIEPAANRFYEPYGFSADNSRIFFASNLGQLSIADDQIDSISVNGTGLLHLTKPPRGSLFNYNEFAWDMPSGSIIYGSSIDATSGGLDYWTMNPDGTNQQRLTYFNSPWSTQALGRAIAGSLAFNPSNPNEFITAVSPNTNTRHVDAYAVYMDPSSGGLSEQYYSGRSFGQLRYTTAANPSHPYYLTGGAPAPGVPASNYSIKWTGTLTPPASGTYTFCVVADQAARVQLVFAGKQLISARNFYGKRQCATVAETAGTPVPIEMEYEQAYGPAYAQLSWIPPLATSPTEIPNSALSATASTASGSPAKRHPRTATAAKASLARLLGSPLRLLGSVLR